MSEYLVDRLEHAPNVEVSLNAEVTELHGNAALENITIVNRETGESKSVPAGGIFVMIGADPCTGWLRGSVALDEKGFVRTDSAKGAPFATSHGGIFAVGDVRSGSVKRVASAVGEGSVVIQAVHRYLASSPKVAANTVHSKLSTKRIS